MKLLFLMSFMIFSTSLAAENGFATFVLAKGKVSVIDKNNVDRIAKVNSKVYVGETIVTGKDARAKLVVFNTRNVINVLPDTRLKFSIISSADAKNVQLDLIEGRVRSNVGDKFDNKSSKFEIRTTTAVAGVRGTQFVVSHSPHTQVTEVITLRGIVYFRGLSGAGEVLVNKSEKSSVERGQAPNQPSKIEKSEMNSIEQDTTVKKDESEGGGQGDSPSAGIERADDNSDAGLVGASPIQNPNSLPVNGTVVPQRLATPVKINIK